MTKQPTEAKASEQIVCRRTSPAGDVEIVDIRYGLVRKREPTKRSNPTNYRAVPKSLRPIWEKPIRIIDETGGETNPQVREGLPKRQQTEDEIGHSSSSPGQ